MVQLSSVAALAGLRLAQVAVGDAFRHCQADVQRAGELQCNAPGDQHPGDDGCQGGDAHLQLRQIDVAMGLRQFILHKGVSQCANLLGALAQLPANLLFVLTGWQVSSNVVFVIVECGQQRLQLSALRITDAAAQGAGGIARFIDSGDQRRC